MLSPKKIEEPVFQFLAGTFHQDIDSPEEALQELITEESKEYLESAVIFLTDFVGSDYSDIAKNEYIQECAEGVYFPATGLEPLDWIYQVIEQIREAVKIK